MTGCSNAFSLERTFWEGGEHPVPGNILQFHLKERSTPQEWVPFPGKSFPSYSCSSADISCRSTSMTDPTSPSLTSLGREIPMWSRTRTAMQQLSHKMEIGMARGDHPPSQGRHKTRHRWELFFPNFTGETEPKQEPRPGWVCTKQGFKDGTPELIEIQKVLVSPAFIGLLGNGTVKNGLGYPRSNSGSRGFEGLWCCQSR